MLIPNTNRALRAQWSQVNHEIAIGKRYRALSSGITAAAIAIGAVGATITAAPVSVLIPVGLGILATASMFHAVSCQMTLRQLSVRKLRLEAQRFKHSHLGQHPQVT